MSNVDIPRQNPRSLKISSLERDLRRNLERNEIVKISKSKFEELAFHIIHQGLFQDFKVLAGLATSPYKGFEVWSDPSSGKPVKLFYVPAILKNRLDANNDNMASFTDNLSRFIGDSAIHAQNREAIVKRTNINIAKDDLVDMEAWSEIARFYSLPMLGGLIDEKGKWLDSNDTTQEEIETVVKETPQETIGMDDGEWL
tara:strand:- start:163468 stop:164064 length:597 start_codon:yes stop_codon:yes gene_type:complete